MLQELTRMTMHMRDQRFNSTHASAKAVPLERLHTSLGAGVVKGQGDQYWLRPQFQCDIDEEIWKDSQEEKTFLWNHFHVSSSMSDSLFINDSREISFPPHYLSISLHQCRIETARGARTDLLALLPRPLPIAG